MDEKTKTPGLRFRNGRPIWRATKAAVAAGYQVKYVNLAALQNDEAALTARCVRLQAEMDAWLLGSKSRSPVFDGTISHLLRIYQIDEDSPYRGLKSSSRHPYDIYLRMLVMEVGTRQIEDIDGRDLRRWHREWSDPIKKGQKRRLAAAKMAMTVLKAALSFGKTCRLFGCADLKSIIEDIEFPSPRPRTQAPTADDVVRARGAAHRLGHPAAALAYAIQFEGAQRQYDIIGEWVPLADRRPSALINGQEKWIGPTWAQVDANLILRLTPSKTETTTEVDVAVDFRTCPMVMEELAGIDLATLSGPLIINPATRLPYRQWYFRNLWRKVANECGIDRAVWNRDLRAGGITEARQAGAPTDDVAKQAGHSDKRMTARVYDRDTLEAARRVIKARTDHRKKNEG